MNFLERLIEDPVRFARLKRVCIALLVLVVALEVALPLIFPGGHHYFSFESFPAFGSIYGLASCAVIIVVSKFIGNLGLMRPEDSDDA